MKLNLLVYRRMLFIYAAIVVAIALVLALGVIGPVKVEASLGPSMQVAVILMFICAVADFLTGALVVTTAFLQPKKA